MYNVKQKFLSATRSLKDKADAAAITASVMLMTANNYVCADNWFSNGTKTSISSAPDTGVLVGNVINVIGLVCRVAGLFMVAGGFVKYLQSRSEDNASGESKAAWAMGIGMAFVAMPTLLSALFAA